MKVVTVVGTRPQFIKASPLSRALRKTHHELLVYTGQHYDHQLYTVFFDELGIPNPDYSLGVGSGTHAYQTAEVLKGLERVLLKEKPDICLIYGDTNSTLAGALASVKLRIPLAHVEAGMRRYDKTIAEEINTVLADHCSRLLFCSTQTAVNNLEKEGIVDGVHLVGDVMYDALLYSINLADKRAEIMEKLVLTSKEYLLVTIRRPENTDNADNLTNIARALVNSAEKVVFPVHPRTLKSLKKYDLYNGLFEAPNVVLSDPLGYLDFLKVMKNARGIVTDSGGIQKEAYLLKVPCISVLESTPWVETVADGWNVLVDAEEESIIREIKEFKPNHSPGNPYGDGRASERIRDILLEYEANL